jgi:hypothetical protein
VADAFVCKASMYYHYYYAVAESNVVCLATLKFAAAGNGYILAGIPHVKPLMRAGAP